MSAISILRSVSVTVCIGVNGVVHNSRWHIPNLSGLKRDIVLAATDLAFFVADLLPVDPEKRSVAGRFEVRWWLPRKDTWRPTGDCAIVPPMMKSRTMMRRGEGDCSYKMQQNAGESLRASAGPSLLPWPWAVDAGQTEKLKLGKRRCDHGPRTTEL